MAEKIAGLIQDEVRERHKIHCFVSQCDFERDGWETRILLGNEAGRPVSYLMNEVQTTAAALCRSLSGQAPYEFQHLLESKNRNED